LDRYESLRRLLQGSALSEAFQGLMERYDPQKDAVLKPLLDLAFYKRDLRSAFPSAERNSQMDILCETNTGLVTIEFQIAKQEYWDDRAMAYIAGVYARQLVPGLKWETESLDRVMGINLLGDGSLSYWGKQHYRRHYQMADTRLGLHLPHLQLIQYSLGDVESTHADWKDPRNKALFDTLEFFKAAHEKEEVPQDVAESLRKGYALVSVSQMKEEVPSILEEQTTFFASLQQHDSLLKQLGEERKATQIAKGMMEDGLPDSTIAKYTGLSLEALSAMRHQDAPET
jgi:predicted transposase/invertase (TIGR01784 family)